MLEFDQFRQFYRLPCAVFELAAGDPPREATLWHNRLFNPALPDDVRCWRSGRTGRKRRSEARTASGEPAVTEVGMAEWNLPWNGGCRCGQVRFRISAPPLVTDGPATAPAVSG